MKLRINVIRGAGSPAAALAMVSELVEIGHLIEHPEEPAAA
ncbi:hypothetical protein AB0L47_22495 [Streptomyces bobili]